MTVGVSRESALMDWLATVEPVLQRETLTLIAGDASPRRYYRISLDTPSGAQQKTLIAVDSPPSEKNPEFLAVQALLSQGGVRVPQVLATDLERGFLLLEDLGNDLLLPALSDYSAGAWYAKAFSALDRMAGISCESAEIPRYDRQQLMNELNLFRDWFVTKLLAIPWNDESAAVFEALCNDLVRSALSQPSVLVHRDFHSRNLMCLPSGELAVIDFQDAVIGPVTYDPVSLLKDCYIAWPRRRQLAWLQSHQQTLEENHRVPPHDFAQWIVWFDLMGLQRHIKVLGIFARLYLRDGKAAYLNDLPLVMAYVRSVLSLYSTQQPNVSAFSQWFEELLPTIEGQSWYREVILP